MKKCLNCHEIFSTASWACPVCCYEPLQINNFYTHASDLADGGGGYRLEYFGKIAGLEAENFWFRVRNDLIKWALQFYKADAENFLEVGCGTGFVLAGLADNNPRISLSGSEIFLAGLSYASERVPCAEFMQMDARHVPFENEFDAIGAFDVLEHIEEDESVLIQLFAALKINGILLLTVPQHPWLWSITDDYACHVRRYTKVDIENKIKHAGFEIVRSTSFVTFLLPIMIASRLFKSMGRNSASYDINSELKLNWVLNWIFLKIMKFEERIIKTGFNFSVGGSRIIVCRKA